MNMNNEQVYDHSLREYEKNFLIHFNLQIMYLSKRVYTLIGDGHHNLFVVYLARVI